MDLQADTFWETACLKGARFLKKRQCCQRARPPLPMSCQGCGLFGAPGYDQYAQCSNIVNVPRTAEAIKACPLLCPLWANGEPYHMPRAQLFVTMLKVARTQHSRSSRYQTITLENGAIFTARHMKNSAKHSRRGWALQGEDARTWLLFPGQGPGPEMGAFLAPAQERDRRFVYVSNNKNFIRVCETATLVRDAAAAVDASAMSSEALVVATGVASVEIVDPAEGVWPTIMVGCECSSCFSLHRIFLWPTFPPLN